MRTASEHWTISQVLKLETSRLLTPNPEYQRGQVWTKLQQQMLIDSLMRGFHLPIFYFDLITTETPHSTNTSYEIVDGQQRVNAIVGYYSGDFSLLDPRAPGSRFPRHLRDEECEWAGKSYDRLSSELQERFKKTKITVALIREAVPNEARDLFVRLQGAAVTIRGWTLPRPRSITSAHTPREVGRICRTRVSFIGVAIGRSGPSMSPFRRATRVSVWSFRVLRPGSANRRFGSRRFDAVQVAAVPRGGFRGATRRGTLPCPVNRQP